MASAERLISGYNIFKLKGKKGYYVLKGLKFHKLSEASLKRIKKTGIPKTMNVNYLRSKKR